MNQYVKKIITAKDIVYYLNILLKEEKEKGMMTLLYALNIKNTNVQEIPGQTFEVYISKPGGDVIKFGVSGEGI